MRRFLRRSFHRRDKGKMPAKDASPGDDASPSAALSTSPRLEKYFPSGIKLLHQPTDAIVDIVFVHGLTGDREKTWTAPDAAAPWPATLLPNEPELKRARILTFGYDAYVTNWRYVVSKNRIGNHARDLLATLATYRVNNNTNNRPIIFVAHSLGGLVCEDALLSSRNAAERHLQEILLCTRAIAFLGTPHSGSGLARCAELLAKSIGLIKQTNPNILGVLEADSEVLARIQTDFHTMLRARAREQTVEMTCFYEQLPLPVLGEVVPMDSAILPAYMSIGIRENHMDMTKFATDKHPGFISLVGELRRWVRGLEPAASAADGGGNSNAPASEVPYAPAVESQDSRGSRGSGGVFHHGHNYGAGNVVYGSQTISGSGTVQFENSNSN